MALNQGTLDALINAAFSGDAIDNDKLVQALGMISDKIFGVGEAKDSAFPTLTSDQSILTEARGVTFPLAKADANGIIHLGQPRFNGVGCIAMEGPATAASMPAGSAAMNGVIFTQKSAANLIFYSNGIRYLLLGTAF